MATADMTAICTHLDALYSTVDAGYLAIFHSPSNRTTWVPATDRQMAASTIARLSQTGNVFIGVGVQPAPLGPSQRGAAATVCALPGLFMDIDLDGGEHTETALPGNVRDVATMLKEELPALPNLVIHSGGGLHCYWLFHEAWVLESDEERKQAALLNRRLQGKLIAAAAQRGWKLDSTYDLARVLRPAGTVNRKRPDMPVPVRILRDGPQRYSVEELEYFLPAEHETFRSKPRGDVAEHAPIALWSHVIGKCGYLRHCVKDAATLTEPEWHAAMTVVARCRGGDEIAHTISQDYPAYDQKETDKKFAYSLRADAPLRCETIRYHRGGEPWCAQCVAWGAIASPIELGYPRGYGRPQRPQRASDVKKEAANA